MPRAYALAYANGGRIEGGTNMSVAPGSVTLKLDRRMIPAADPEQVEADVRRVIEQAASAYPGITLGIKRLLLARALQTLPGNAPPVDALHRHGEAVFGEPIPTTGGSPLYTDVRLHCGRGIPAVIYGAGPRTEFESTARRAGEHLLLEDLHRATKVVAHAAGPAGMRCASFGLVVALTACGGGGGGSGDPAPAPVIALPANAVSAASPVAPGCTGGSVSGSFFANAEVEPFVAIDPGNSQHLVATWQQDRWSDGGARALVTAASFDGGRSWARVLQPMSRCGGGTPANGGDYERVSDPWVDIGIDGTVHAMGLAFSGKAAAAASNAVLASRSTDGGLSWSKPVALIADGAAFFNDKNSLSADPTDARYVYAVWDRLAASGGGPTYFARSADAGLTWQAARPIYDPGAASQTIGNRVVVIGDGPGRGTLINFFTQIDVVAGTTRTSLMVIRSSDKGQTWAAPLHIADMMSVGTRDPGTGTPIRDGSILGSIAAGPGGALWATWQDGRFSGGQRDAIAVSRSADAGLTWSAPVAINRDPSVSAFTPVVTVRADGTAGVLHYDLRPNTGATNTLLAGAWLLTSRDGITWTETTVWSPFDVSGAPRVDAGLFLGDYQGLASSATSFLPLLALSSTDAANPTDIFLLAQGGLAASAQRTHEARVAPPGALSAQALQLRVHENTVRSMERRLPGWSRRMGIIAPPR